VRRASLRECEADEDLCALVDIKGADATAAALLVECRGRTPEDLRARIAEVTSCIRRTGLPLGCNASRPRDIEDYAFTADPKEYKVFWDVRKGLIPIVGAAREAGASLCAPMRRSSPRTGAGVCLRHSCASRALLLLTCACLACAWRLHCLFGASRALPAAFSSPHPLLRTALLCCGWRHSRVGCHWACSDAGVPLYLS
jgi:hypothetical protein